LFKYFARAVDEACERAGVAGRVNPKKWNYEQLMRELRCVFVGRKDHALSLKGLPMGDQPHYLAGVNPEDIRDAIVNGTLLPAPRELPPLKAPAAVVKAAVSGVDVVYAKGEDVGPTVSDIEPEASSEALQERLANRLMPPDHRTESSDYVKRWGKGWHAQKARNLRSYLTESAVQMYLDRFARLASQDYERTELEAVERLWALRAVDDLWQNHLVQMEVLRTSVQVRSFGLLDPRDEFRIDGARAFVSLVETLREDIVKNIFFFVGASAEPIADFESLGEEGASQTQTEV